MVGLLVALLAPFGLQQPPDGWKRVELTATVSITLPESAEKTSAAPAKGFELPPGEKLDHWEFIEGRNSFVVGINTFGEDELKDVTPDQVLANSIRGSINGLGAATIKLQRDILFNGWPGIEFTLEGDDTSGVSRTYVIDRTMYQILEVFPTAKGRPSGTDAFLNSLSLRPPPPPGPLKKPGPLFEAFFPKGAGCSIRMPGKAKLFTSAAVDSSKPAFTQYLTEYGNRVYMLGYVDLPKDKTPDEMRQSIIGQLLLAFEAEAPNPATMSKRGGLEYDTVYFNRKTGEVGRADIALANGRAYAIIMLYPPGHAGSPDIDTFFNSFKILGSEPKAK